MAASLIASFLARSALPSPMTDSPTASAPRFAAARFIKEIGRGAKGARSLSQADAHTLFQAIFAGEVDDLELGGILLAYRIKGEEVAELAGMLEAAHAYCATLQAPAGKAAPCIIPCYNGARKQPNLTPLLALLLAREGIPVLLHGVTQDTGRVTTAEILRELGYAPAASVGAIQTDLDQRGLSFAPLTVLSPALAKLLSQRARLGVRNSGHTLAKMLQPFGAQNALRLVNYTHPEYLQTLSAYFLQHPANVLLARGTEGEAVADARRLTQITWFAAGQQTVVAPAQEGSLSELPALPPQADALSTAKWIQDVLAGTQAVPVPIARQVACIREICTKT